MRQKYLLIKLLLGDAMCDGERLAKESGWQMVDDEREEEHGIGCADGCRL